MQSTQKLGPWPRFGARFIDGLVLFIPILIVTVPIAGGFAIGSSGGGGKQFIASTLAVLLAYAYFVVMESNSGGTIGKNALKIKVTTPNGKPTLEQAAKRNAWMLASIVPLLGGFLSFALAITIAVTIASSETGQGFHDKLADSQLIRDA